ncbi:hypothetical protein GIB67_027067 [Kingdonia uniflora]|uniref:Uncharacterized protein n=1 Tax=Kingdonia uniflora TaxID=39325 RepID=A0A7J7P2B6_9MAGN|nr:hypothetical protein GIB67_027067 [Kingdonia uniflora]
MRVQWFVILTWFTGFSYLLSTVTSRNATLVPDEVEALKEIGKTLGKVWNFSVDPCSGEQGWATPNPLKGFDNNVSCDCNGTVCHVIGM